jgi:hypothetical protein
MRNRRSHPSNVPLARRCIYAALRECEMDALARRYCWAALRLMTRREAVRRAPAKAQRITSAQKRQVLALNPTELTIHEIANQVGLPNSGRVSEILNGLR